MITILKFDPILIESRQALTVTLMLDSPEEEVLTRACEAIFRFADKGIYFVNPFLFDCYFFSNS